MQITVSCNLDSLDKLYCVVIVWQCLRMFEVLLNLSLLRIFDILLIRSATGYMDIPRAYYTGI